MTGKERCEFLRNIRKNIAEKNNLDYEPHECTFEGLCPGYCPVCDAEAADLMRQIEKKEASGIAIKLDEDSIKALEEMSKNLENIDNDVQVCELMGDLIEPSDIDKPSDYVELPGIIRQPSNSDEIYPQTDISEDDYYALSVVNTFIKERLDGDINKLKYFDISSIFDDAVFGNCENPYRNGKLKTKLLSSIISLVFSDAWPQMSYENIDRNMFMANEINVWYNHFDVLFGNYGEYDKYKVPDGLDSRVKRFEKSYFTIGNVIVLPNGLNLLRNSKPFGGGYPDIFFSKFYKMMVHDKHCDFRMIDAMYMKSKELNEFRTEENFLKVMKGLMLGELLDDNNKPKHIFEYFSVFTNKGFTRNEYIEHLTQFLDFAESIISERADRIIAKLKIKLDCYVDDEAKDYEDKQETNNQKVTLRGSDEYMSHCSISHWLNDSLLNVLIPNSEDNILISPYRIQVVLMIIAKLADGNLRHRIVSVLSHNTLSFNKLYKYTPIFESDEVSKIEANTIFWLQKGLKCNQQAINDLSNNFGSCETALVDFSSPEIITIVNDKVKVLTHGLIDSIDIQLDELTNFLLTDVLYFKANWQEAFDEDDTFEQPFYGTRGVVNVPMMHNTSNYRYRELNCCRLLDLVYNSESDYLAMRIILPNSDSSINQALDEIKNADYCIGSSQAYVALTLPKFSITEDNNLVQILSNIGLHSIFSSADVVPELYPELSISQMKQKVRVDIDENGTEAAAVTYACMVGCLPVDDITPEPILFEVNRPFVFEIYSFSFKQILFSGVINNIE